MPDGYNTANRELIITLAARYGIPAIFDNRQYAELGGLISYGVDLVENIRLSAGYIDRILKGAKPADLPVQEPTKFEMVINMKTAKALGLTVTNSMEIASRRCDRIGCNLLHCICRLLALSCLTQCERLTRSLRRRWRAPLVVRRCRARAPCEGL